MAELDNKIQLEQKKVKLENKVENTSKENYLGVTKTSEFKQIKELLSKVKEENARINTSKESIKAKIKLGIVIDTKYNTKEIIEI